MNEPGSSIMPDGSVNFPKFLVEGTKPNLKKIHEYVEPSLMLVTALSPVIGYDKAAKVAHEAHVQGISLREACLKLGYLSGEEFDQLVRPADMTHP